MRPTGEEEILETGVLYVAAGERYLDAAKLSAQSVRELAPDLPLAVATDHDDHQSLFDIAMDIPSGDGYRAKILAMQRSPFDRTILLDVDTYVAGGLEDVFVLLETFHVALAHAPNRITMNLRDVPESFPEFNTGVIAFRRDEVVQRTLQKWLEEYDRLQPDRPPSKDQPSFRRVAYFEEDLRIATLPPEFNQRFQMAGYLNLPVRVLHGWASEQEFVTVSAAMNRLVGDWDARAVFAGGRLFDHEGTCVFEYGGEEPSLEEPVVRQDGWFKRLSRLVAGKSR